jgi:hypothetical protein
MHNTSAALAGVTAHMGARQSQMIPDIFDQQSIAGNITRYRFAVHSHRNFHSFSPYS